MSYDAFISYSHAADGLLAPRLQAGLQRFAKRMLQLRALRIFRDEASLAANPHLWSSITNALDDAEWFVLLLSPEAAQSEWVGREIEHWKQHKDPARILPVVTAGTFGWDNGDVAGDAVPPALSGAFTEEPRWVDLRWARTDEQLDLKNPRFSAAIADIASAVRGIPKDQLESEEVKQHRRTVRTAWAAGIVVLLLGIAATIGAVVATNESNRANDQADLAASEADRANAEADRANTLADEEATARSEADANAVRADANAAEATANSELAEARALLASAVGVLDEDPELTVLLVSAAASIAGTQDASFVQGTIALREAQARDRLIARFDVASSGFVYTDLAAEGDHLAAASLSDRSVVLYDVDTRTEIWRRVFTDTNDSIRSVAFGPNEQVIAVSISDEPYGGDAEGVALDGNGADEHPARMYILDAATGETIHVIFPGDCAGSRSLSEATFTPDGRWLLIYTGTAACSDGLSEDWVAFFRTSDWQLDFVIDHGTRGFAVFSDDMNKVLLAADDAPSELRSFPDMEVLHTFDVRPFGSISGQADRIVVADPFGGSGGGFRPELFDGDGVLVDVLEVENFLSAPLLFSPDGAYVLAANRAHDAILDARTGSKLFTLPNAETIAASFNGDGTLLATAQFGPDAGTILLWDVGPIAAGTRLEVATFTPWWINADRIQEGSLPGVWILGSPLADDVRQDIGIRALVLIDPDTGEVVHERRIQSSVNLPDGRYLVSPERVTQDGRVFVGPLVAWDPVTGLETVVDDCVVESYTAEFQTDCDPGAFVASMVLSHDLSEVAVAGWTPDDLWHIRIYDTSTLTEVRTITTSVNVEEMIAFDDQWIMTLNPHDPFWTITIIDSGSGSMLFQLGDRPWRGSRALSADGSMIYLGLLTGEIIAVDTATWREVDQWRAHDGNNRGLALSPSGQYLASTGEDGFITVWDLSNDRTLVDKIPAEFPSDAMFVDEWTLAAVLAINQEWAVFDLLPDAVLAAAEQRLTRTFTPAECELYLIDPCPSLEQIRNR